MDIGEERRQVTFEPVELPQSEPAPSEPAPAAEPVKEPEPVGV